MKSADKVKPARAYRSRARREGALVTRATILEAARKLLVERGYAATSVEAIASAAGVAAETVYLHFGTKRDLLANLLDVALVGDDDPVSLLDRPWMRSVLRQPDAPGRVRALARRTREMLDRLGPLHTVMRAAAEQEPSIADLARAHAIRRLQGQSALVAWIAEPAGLRAGLSHADATERFFALTSPELHHLFTRGLGWSGRRYEEWLARSVADGLLPPG